MIKEITLISSATIKPMCRLEGGTESPFMIRSDLSDRFGRSQRVCKTSNKAGIKSHICFDEVNLYLPNRVIKTVKNKNTHSILLRALNTSFPIPKPMGSVTPGALNFSQASKKLIAETKPTQMKMKIIEMGRECVFVFIIALDL